MGSIAQGFGDCRMGMTSWVLGQLIERSSDDVIRTGINKTPQAKSVYTIVVDTATNDAVYTWTVGEVGRQVTLTYTADAATSKIEIAAGIVAAIDANPTARGQCSAVSDGVDTVTITALWPGIEVVVSDADAKLTSTQVTAAAGADVIPFARALIGQGSGGYGGADQYVALAKSSLLTAQVAKLAPTYIASAKIRVRVYEIRGLEEECIADRTETSASDLATTLTALAATLNAKLPADSVVVTVSDTNTKLTFTAEVAGFEFRIEAGAGDEGASVPADAVELTTGPNELTSFHRAFKGVSLHSHSDPTATIGGTAGQYAANSAVPFVKKGPVAVASSQTINAQTDAVYVELAGADTGKFFNTDSATRIRVGRHVARWERDGDSGTSTLAALRVAA